MRILSAMTNRRHDWSYVQQRILARMKQLGMHENMDLVRASGLSVPVVADFTTSKHPRATNNRKGSTIPKLCAALRWRDDAIERLLDGLEPVELDENGDLASVVSISPIDQLDARVAKIEGRGAEGLREVLHLQEQIEELVDRVLRLEAALDDLQRGERRSPRVGP